MSTRQFNWYENQNLQAMVTGESCTQTLLWSTTEYKCVSCYYGHLKFNNYCAYFAMLFDLLQEFSELINARYLVRVVIKMPRINFGPTVVKPDQEGRELKKTRATCECEQRSFVSYL